MSPRTALLVPFLAFSISPAFAQGRGGAPQAQPPTRRRASRRPVRPKRRSLSRPTPSGSTAAS